jgi:FixJ family two-component response regulator
MNISEPGTTALSIGVSLVDGDATIRHARQLMLRSENYNVRSYATCAALLADPRSRDFSCIVLDIELNDEDGAALLREMRATGWRGRAILLDGDDPGVAEVREAEKHGDRVMKRTVGDRSLVVAISALVDRGWSSWNAVG